jgi:3-hydroxyacyl-CoA dehydrogenase
MGKEVVVIKESPGFITSRINAMIGNEAFYMLEEGIASAADIDKALKLGLNHPMGPFELVDLVGLDTRLNILEYLHKTLGEKYRPAPLLVQYVEAGRLGRKSGRGVYEYPEKKEATGASPGVEIVRQELASDPTNLDIANRYWKALGSCNGDVRSGQYVIEAYRAAALDSLVGAGAFAKAYKELFQTSGEAPRAEYFDQDLIRALSDFRQKAADQDGSNISWVLASIDRVR